MYGRWKARVFCGRGRSGRPVTLEVRKALAGVKGFADRGIVAEDRQLVAYFKDRIRTCRNRFFPGFFHQHDQDAGIRFQTGLRQRNTPILVGDVVQRYQRDGFGADIVQKHDGIERIRTPDQTIREILKLMIAPGPHVRKTHENEDDGNRRKGDQRPGIIVLHLAELQRQEDVDESRNDRDVEHIAEKHRDPCEPAAGTVGDKQFTLPGGVAAACQQRDDLKPRPLIRQAGKPEQNRKQFRDNPVDQNDERE